ncbi:2Fe-2S iron-sulfur cluster-binding protein [Methylogaea oryzae]|uniref:2Fe-2S iron-sulfur cluster-binding protein n=1 Tax=Methylogaea oryzae TaxID=1295382 RepID=UPI000B28CBD3|nr:2Fe-2S iron-sulfur cluster-binding protein [Methylogaea oryzae]
MANITFSNPDYKDKTVYAVAGSHTQTILKLALENKIPINFNCQDGECGTCLVKVTSLDKKTRMAARSPKRKRASWCN